MTAPRETAWARFLGIIAALALVLALGVPAYAQEGGVEPEPGVEEAAAAAEGEGEAAAEAEGEPLPDRRRPASSRTGTLSGHFRV